MHLVRHGACQPLGVHVVLFLAHVSRRRRRRRGGLRSRGCGLAVFEEERLDADEEPLDRVGNDLRRLDSLLSFLILCIPRKSSVVVHGPRSVARRDKRGFFAGRLTGTRD